MAQIKGVLLEMRVLGKGRSHKKRRCIPREGARERKSWGEKKKNRVREAKV